jgi:predicted dienelactone hydrolase
MTFTASRIGLWLAMLGLGAGSLLVTDTATSRDMGWSTWTTPVSAEMPVDPLAVDSSLYRVEDHDWHDAGRSRDVPVRLYLPPSMDHDPTPRPLLVFSHGIGGARDDYKYLGAYLASRGYVVVHVQHVGSDRQLWRGNPFTLVSRLSEAATDTEAIHRVSDIRYALDTLLNRPLANRIDQDRIFAGGHSYGANTAMLLSGARVERNGRRVSLRDPRIRAAVLISAPPFYGAGSLEPILADVMVPTLHITATGDEIRIPGYESGLSDRIAVFDAMAQRSGALKVLAIFNQGSHSVFTDRRLTGGVSRNPQIKLATREMLAGFLDSMVSRDPLPIDRWRLAYDGLLARLEGPPR